AAVGHLVVGRAPLAAALTELTAEGRPDLVLGLVHHPPALWADFEQADVQPRFEAGCDLLLHGPGAPDAGRWIGAPGVNHGAVWADLHADHVALTPLTPGPDGRWVEGPRRAVALPRALPTAERLSASPSMASRRPPDLEGYLRHVEDEWGYVLLTGLLKDRAQAAVSVRSIYVSLHSQHPQAQGPSDHRTVDVLRRRLLSTPPDATADGPILAEVRAALQAVGVPDSAITDRAAHHSWQRLQAAPERDFDAVVRGLQTLDLELAIARGRKVLVQGDPGTGKSTTLQHVAVALVDACRGKPEVAEALGFEHPFPLPVLVPMRRFWAWLTHRPERFAQGGAELLLDYLRASVAHHAGGDGWIEPALAAGEVAVLLDGLDEVPVALERERAARCVRDFVHRFDECWYGVTSRPAGLGPAERLAFERAGLTTVRVQPLEPDQIERFVQAWYGALIPDARDAKRKARDLLDRIADNPLTRTPITLIATAIVHHTLGDLPERRAELYEHCVQALSGRWDDAKEEAGARLAGGLSRAKKVRLLQRLAHEIHQQGEAGGQTLERGPAIARIREAFPDHERPDQEGAEALLDLLGGRSGLLVPEGQRAWRFRHLTFQEYLTARHLCDEREDAAQVLAARLHDPWWREVVLLAVGYKAKDAGVQGRKLVAHLAD
ncbi:MAG: NACHT domain-containing protein, partial [Myxococcales bacterium]|nr:NACHT domain-containing protein [Myxococcales bacterium]